MRNRVHLRNLGLLVAAIVAVAAIAYAASDHTPNHSADETASYPGEAGVGSSGAGTAPVSGGPGAVTSESAGDGKAIGGFDLSPEKAAPQSAANVASAAPDGGPVASGGDLASTVDRKIISSASIQLQVDDVGASFSDVARIATSAGGFVASSSFSYQDDDKQVADVTIRVPADSYQSALTSLRNLGVKVDGESSDTSDVTEQYTDLDSRLRNLQATETQLLTLLTKAETITDILTVQDRLNATRSEIEQVKGRIQLLDNLTDLATISIHLRPVVTPVAGNGNGVDLGSEVSKAWDDSLQFLGDIAAAVVTVIVFAWWIPIAGLALFVAYKAAVRHRPPPSHTAEIAD